MHSARAASLKSRGKSQKSFLSAKFVELLGKKRASAAEAEEFPATRGTTKRPAARPNFSPRSGGRGGCSRDVYVMIVDFCHSVLNSASCN